MLENDIKIVLSVLKALVGKYSILSAEETKSIHIETE